MSARCRLEVHASAPVTCKAAILQITRLLLLSEASFVGLHRDPKVEQFDHFGPIALSCQKKVFRLDITVYDTQGMCLGKSLAGIKHITRGERRD